LDTVSEVVLSILHAGVHRTSFARSNARRRCGRTHDGFRACGWGRRIPKIKAAWRCRKTFPTSPEHAMSKDQIENRSMPPDLPVPSRQTQGRARQRGFRVFGAGEKLKIIAGRACTSSTCAKRN
jgi:hypothetical protein